MNPGQMAKELRRMLDDDVRRIAESFIWAEKQPAPTYPAPAEPDEPAEKIGREWVKLGRGRTRYARVEWELTELFQYSGLDQKDAAWCADAMMQIHGLSRINRAKTIEQRASQSPSSVPKRCDATERKYRQARKEVDEAQASFLTASKSADEDAIATAFRNLNAAWGKYLRLQKMMEHPHVANSFKMLRLFRARDERASKLTEWLKKRRKGP